MNREKLLEGYKVVEATFARENIRETLEKIPNVLAPSQSVMATQAPVVEDLIEDLGHVSRSDGIPCLSVTPNVITIGYHSVNRHHDQGPPMVSLADLENLAIAIFWIGMTLGSNNE